MPNPYQWSPEHSNKAGTYSVDVGSAPSGYGSQYDDLFAANPYRGLTYDVSGMQAFLHNLGFRTKYDDFVDQARINAQEYDAGIFSQIQQNEFNDPSAQAARERAAGINPDLAGIGDVAGAAGPTEDPNGMNVSPSGDEARDVLSFVSQSVMNFIPGVLSFATNLTNLKGARLENDAKELAFGSAAVDAANKFFIEGITEQDYRDAFEKNDWSNILEESKKDSSYLSDTMFSSRAARRRFKLAYGMHSKSLLAEMRKYKTFDDFETYRKSLLSKRASPFFSDNDDDMQNLLTSVLGPLEKYQKRLNEINLQVAELRDPELEQGLRNTQLSNQQIYEDTIDPAAQAEAENSANTRTSQQNEIMKATDDFFSDAMTELGKKDNWWTALARTALGIMRAQVMSNLNVRFGRSSHYSSGPDGVTEEVSSMSTIGF